MTTNVLGKNLTPRELHGCTAYINKKLYRIEELTTTTPTDAIHLHATAEKFATKAALKVSCDVGVAGARMHVYEDSHGLHEAIDLALDKLIAQLKHSTDRQTRNVRKSRATRRKLKSDVETEPSEPGGAVSTDVNRSDVFPQIQPLLPELTVLVEREIERLELAGTLLQGQLVAQDVIDALIIDLYERADRQPEDLSFAQWAEQRARFHLSTMARSEEAQGIHLAIEDIEEPREIRDPALTESYAQG